MYTTLSNGIKIFYREAGSKDGPVILLLHGFPTSSFQYRNLMSALSPKYHVLAPDLPGFGFTEVPSSVKFEYTFANIATTVASFLDAHRIDKFAVYVFDYGAPTGFRIALERPSSITAIITQNGNAYEDGLGDFWAPLKSLWADDNKDIREAIRSAALSFEGIRDQYVRGEPDPDAIDPATYHLDAALVDRPGNKDIQLDLLKDYETNVALYPRFHEYFRRSQVPLLAAWGRNDIIFIPPGAEAFKRDLPNAEIRWVDGGHFALEAHVDEIAGLVLEFLDKNGI